MTSNYELRKQKRDAIETLEIHRDTVIDFIAVWGPLCAPLVPAGLTAAAIIVSFPDLLGIKVWGAWAIAIVTVIALEVLGIVSVETWLDMRRYNAENTGASEHAPVDQALSVVVIYAIVVLSLVFVLKIWHSAALYSLIPLTMLGLITSWTIVLRKQHNQRKWDAEQTSRESAEVATLRQQLDEERNLTERFRRDAESVRKSSEGLRTDAELLRAEVATLRQMLDEERNSSHGADIDSVLKRIDDTSRDVLAQILQAINDGRVTSAADAAKAVDANKTKVYEMFRLANAVGAIYMNGDGAYHVRQ